jgi:hypothetical protein
METQKKLIWSNIFQRKVEIAVEMGLYYLKLHEQQNNANHSFVSISWALLSTWD